MNRYETSENDVTNKCAFDVIEETVGCDRDGLIHKKKHGVWCRLITILHLKKKHSHTNDATKDTKTSKRRKLHISYFRLKVKNKHKKHLFYDETNVDDEISTSPDKKYAPIPDHQDEETFVYRGHRVDFAIVPERYELLEEAECDEVSITNDSGIHEGFSCTSDDDDGENHNVIAADNNNPSLSMAKYLKKQWNGKRSKRTRKRIRRTSGYAWKSLRVGFRAQYLVPDITQISFALQNNSSARRR